mgnify:CR=1 FL=1
MCDYYNIIEVKMELFDAIDRERTIGEIAREHGPLDTARVLFERLWWYDQVVFDASRGKGLPSEKRESGP